MCDHRLPVRVLLDLANTQTLEDDYFNYLTGFNSYTKFQGVLKFALPGRERNNIVYWNEKASKNKSIDTSVLFDSHEEYNLPKVMAVIQTPTLALLTCRHDLDIFT